MNNVKKINRLVLLLVLIMSIVINVYQFVNVRKMRKDIAVDNMNILMEFDDYLFAVDKYIGKESYSQEGLNLLNDITMSYKNIIFQHNFMDIYKQLNRQNYIINSLLEEEITQQEFRKKIINNISDIKDTYRISGDYKDYIKYYDMKR